MSEMGSGTTTKKCPMCAEMIQADALVCRFCGYDYRTPAAPPPVAAQRSASQKTNGASIASLVLGIVWIYGIGSILALIFGYRGKKQIDESNGAEGGRGMAIAGIVLGWVGLAGVILFAVLAFWILSTGRVTSSTFSCTASSLLGGGPPGNC